jgi:hypothetical protein
MQIEIKVKYAWKRAGPTAKDALQFHCRVARTGLDIPCPRIILNGMTRY